MEHEFEGATLIVAEPGRGNETAVDRVERILAVLNIGVGIEKVMDELRVWEAVNVPVAGEEIEDQDGVFGFLEAEGFFVGGLSVS